MKDKIHWVSRILLMMNTVFFIPWRCREQRIVHKLSVITMELMINLVIGPLFFKEHANVKRAPLSFVGI